jgi:hypothetical protein
MKLSMAQQRAPGWYEAGLAPNLVGPIGIGKTSVVTSVPAMLEARYGGKYGIVVLNGGNLDVQDATGYLVPVQRDGHSYSEMTRPWWWTTEEGLPLEQYKGGIIFVDEQDKAPVEVKKVLGEGKLSGRLCSHTLPGSRNSKGKLAGQEGWRIWSAANRGEDRSGSTKALDHLINREQEIKIEPDLDSWTEWATRNTVMPITIGFANNNPQIVFEGKVPEKQGPFCTPRSLVECDSYLQYLAGPDGNDLPTDATTMEEIVGFIGEGAAIQWRNTIKLQQESPKLSDIIAHPDKVKVPQAPDALMLICYELAHRVEDDTLKPVITYIDRFPKEFGVAFAKALTGRKPKLLVHPALNSWCKTNASLMAAIAITTKR